jgi:hypothetical protein
VLEEAGQPVLLAEYRTLSYRTISPVGVEPDLWEVWVVVIQGTDLGAPVQELPKLEAAAEDPVGGATQGTWKGGEPFQDPEPFHGRAV